MKLTAFFLLIAALHVTAGARAQKITLTVRQASLSSVFNEISRQSGVSVMYDEELLKQASPVTLSVKDATIEETLQACLKDQPFAYTLVKGAIVIGQKGSTPVFQAGAVSATPAFGIHGHVTDSAGTALTGASVTVKGTKKGTTTDTKGNFELRNVDENATLIISYSGFEAREFRLSNNPGFKSGELSVILIHSSNLLDQVQIIAYGSTTERLSTGDVTTVSSKEIEEQPVSNPLLALEGRVPGLFISQSTGVSGSGLTIRLQGQNSLSSGNDPLYIVDGVPYSSQLLPNISSIFGILGANGNTNSNAATGGGNPLAFLNPADIESISVLKDADATAIYGSRAANGAILITTKVGKLGRTKVDINCQDGWGRVARTMPLLNTTQYLEMRHEAKANANAAIGPNDYDINGLWDSTRNTNWQKTLIGGTAHYMDDEINVSGGNGATTFLVGAGYHKETTVFPGDMGDQKGSLHFNINNVSANQKFRMQLTGNYVIDNNRLMFQDLTQLAVNLAPDAPALYNADGSLDWAPNAAGNSSWVNPLSYLEDAYTIKTSNVIGNLVTSYQIITGLDIKLSAGYNSLGTNETQIFPLEAHAPETRAYNVSSSIFGTDNVVTWNIEPQVTYKRNIGAGNLDAVLGATALQTSSGMNQTYAYGFSSDQQLYDMSAASSLSANSPSISSVYKYSAGFGRIGYNWKARYLLDVTARRDGSSRFGSANQFHDFGSVSGAWIFSNEGWVKESLSFVSFGKLRVSYGTTGNDQIGDYEYLSLYNTVNANVQNAYQGATGLAPNGLNNPYLQWELTKKLQFGLNLGFLKDRVVLTSNYYRNRSSNQLQRYALPVLTGNGGILINFPAIVENTGWELTLNTTNIRTRDFGWSSSLNLTIPYNKLVSYPGLSTSTYADQYIVGQPVTIMKVYPYLGVDPATGIYQYASQSGKPTSTPNYSIDATSFVNPSQKYFGGFSNTLRYKGIGLDLLFQFVDQVGPNYIHGRFPGRFISSTYVTIGNQPIWVLNRWRTPGDVSLVQKFSSVYSSTLDQAFNSASLSSFGFSDASFIRLKNVALSWQLPAQWVQRRHIQGIRIYVQGQNLLTITHYKGLDPENQTTLALPPLRVLTFGATVTL